MASSDYAALVEVMKQARFYGHVSGEVEHRQTHISDVFLVGELVYKIKKAVDTGFLDFTTLERRERFCRREVELNKRLSSGIYLGVEAITRDGEDFNLGGSGEIVEYAVKMRRLEERDNLEQLLRRDRVPPGFLEELADVLVDFYARSGATEEILRGGELELILGNCRDNFRQLPEAARAYVDERKLEIVRAATEGFARRHAELFGDRVRQGRICDGHGDLKCEHVYCSEGVQIIDCIEFNDAFRYQDAAADLAFLAVDMDSLGRPSAPLAILSRYVHRTGDRGLMLLIDFYKCYRAMVQVKVQGFKLAGSGTDEAAKRSAVEALGVWVDLAYQYAVKMVRPVLWVVCGLTATGKSTIAGRLAALFDVEWIRSDRLRKEIYRGHEGQGESGFGAGIYSPAATSHVYARMLLAAQEELAAGRSVLLDATFRRGHERQEVLRLAGESHASVIFLECRCPEGEILRRLKRREERPGLSDARLEHWQEIKATSEPCDDLPPESHIVLRTDEPIDDTIECVLEQMYALLAEQVRREV